jgi:hypothetical protein
LHGRRVGHVSFEYTAAKPARERRDENQARACEPGTDEGDPHRDVISWQLAWAPCCE